MRASRKVLVLLLSLVMIASCQAVQPDRQMQVAERGTQVMPFDLERTTHIFEKLENGGLQQVISDDGDAEQIQLIREHLAVEAIKFSQGDFHDPEMIHGEDMTGLHELVTGAERLTIAYSDIKDGAQILFMTADADLVAALHAWFDQQIADHGAHAVAQRSVAAEPTATAAADRPTMGMGMMGNSMRVAHHARIPEAYAGLTNPAIADDASLERGAQIFTSSCAVCHGDGGMGDGPAAVNLDPPVSPVAHTSQMLSDAYLFWRVSEGGQGDPLQSAMPAWKGTLDEQARWDVISYVQALGQGVVQPRSHMGGMMFDPAIEQQNRQAMLVEAINEGLIDQVEADTFDLVHTALDELMAETGLRMQGSNLPALLAILTERGVIVQTQADDFQHVHDLLLEAGLMR